MQECKKCLASDTYGDFGDVNTTGEAPLGLGLWGVGPDRLFFCIAQDCRTCIHYAVEAGRQEIVRLLLHAKAFVDQEETANLAGVAVWGRAPIHLAAGNADIPMLKLLLEALP